MGKQMEELKDTACHAEDHGREVEEEDAHPVYAGLALTSSLEVPKKPSSSGV